MAPFDDLPADQKAVLQLVLRQGRSYEEIAGLLKISPEAVRDRALTALDTIGPQDLDGLEADRQDEVGDYLLGQQSASARAGTRTFLEGSAPARIWARQVSSDLRDAGVEGGLGEVPADPQEVDEAFDALDARQRARAEQERSSRLGGVLLLVGLGLIVALALLAVFGAFDGGNGSGKGDSVAATTSTPTQTTTGTQVEAQVNLTRPAGASGKALGVANIVSQDGQRAIAVVGQDLPASGHYVLWLRNGAKLKFLGFFPVVASKGKDAGRLQGLVGAPSDLTSYKEMLVSREPSSSPKQPTQIVLRGSLGG
jgi:Sigma-70, region 4